MSGLWLLCQGLGLLFQGWGCCVRIGVVPGFGLRQDQHYCARFRFFVSGLGLLFQGWGFSVRVGIVSGFWLLFQDWGCCVRIGVVASGLCQGVPRGDSQGPG